MTKGARMTIHFTIPNTDPTLFEKAQRVAEDFANTYKHKGVIGIVFLGALARGYFDAYADIDIVLFKAGSEDIFDAGFPRPDNYTYQEGFEIHSDVMDYLDEWDKAWDMAKRWAYSTRRVFYDPAGLLDRLFDEKILLRHEERRWLMIEGMTQSLWYCDSLPRLWIARGNLVSAQHMFDEGLTHFFNALFALNKQLVPDVKWRYYCAAQLPSLPPRFDEQIQAVMRLGEMTEAEVERRRAAFLALWEAALPQIEAEVGMAYEEFAQLV